MKLPHTIPPAMLLAALVLFAPAAAAQDKDPMILIHTGTHFIWYTKQSIWTAHQADISAYFDYMDREFSRVISDWGIQPPREQYYLLVDPHTGGGFAAGNVDPISKVTGKESPGIGVAYDAYFNTGPGGIKGFWACAIGTHETMNLLTGQLVSGGWPRNWWADDISPFPAMSAVRVEAELGKNDVSTVHDASFHGDKLYAMFKAIQAHYGWAIFQKTFTLLKADGIKFDHIDSGKNPSPVLTAYVTAYLVLGSGDTLDALDTNYFHNIPGYDKALTAKVLAARADWKEHGGDAAAYLSGKY